MKKHLPAISPVDRRASAEELSARTFANIVHISKYGRLRGPSSSSQKGPGSCPGGLAPIDSKSSVAFIVKITKKLQHNITQLHANLKTKHESCTFIV